MLHHRDIACGGTFVPLPQMAARRDNSSDLGSARAASQMLKKAKGELNKSSLCRMRQQFIPFLQSPLFQGICA